MNQASRRMFGSLALGLLPALGGCGGGGPEAVGTPEPEPVSAASPAPPTALDPPPAPAEAADPADPSSSIKGIMTRLAKGPGSLTPTIGNELKQSPPPWDAIRPQAEEYARLSSLLANFEPPKGTPESWTDQTAAFAASAADLDSAARAGDLDAASLAHDALANSCMSCHREHRPMDRRGRGGPGGPPPGGPPPGGPTGGPPPA